MKKKKSSNWQACLTIRNLSRLSIEKRISLAGWINDRAVEVGRLEPDTKYAKIYRSRYMR